MLTRSLKVPPSLLLFLAFCVFLGYHFSQTPLPAELARPPPPPPAPDAKVPAPASDKKTPRIALITFVTDERSYLQLSLKTKDHYARRHGYDFIIEYEAHSERGTMWWKYEMIERLIKKEKWDWIWWLDFDTLVTNTDIKVTDVIEQTLANATNPDEVDYLLTHDCNGLNLGSFIARGHERSIKFIHDIYAIKDRDSKEEQQMSEQDAMVKLIEEDPASGQRTVQVPQWKLNAFPEEIACFDESKQVWQHGTFILHFAGAWAHVQGDDPTGQLMKKYEPEIIWGDWKEMY